MSYVALYRAYRPNDFNSVAGQTHIVQTLKNAIRLDKVSHAYLFSGPRGTGKTSLAKIMAKSLNCLNKTSEEPCNLCSNCLSINQGNFSDVIEIDAASNNGVDEIREIRDRVKYLPTDGKYKVYIIDEVHMLSNGAFNALLKTLEEPPAHVVFILATTEPHKIPQTILSRVQRFDFQSISSADVLKRLSDIVSMENILVTQDSLEYISEICEGGMRDALSLLDQCISFKGETKISKDDVLLVSGNVSDETLLELLLNCSLQNQENVLKLIDDIIKNGKEINIIVSDIIVFLRNVLLYRAGYFTSSLYKTAHFIEFNNKVSDSLIYLWIEELNKIANNIKFTNQKRVYLEVGLLKMSEKNIKYYEELVKKLDLLEKEVILLKTNNFKPIEITNQPKEETFEVYEFKEEENIDIELDDSFISVLDVVKILYNSDKTNKEKINQTISNLYSKNPNNVVISMIYEGLVAAGSATEALFVLENEAKCNRLMKQENYEKVIKLLPNISNFICIPKHNWDVLSKEYISQYKQGIKKPILNSINILVKKYIKQEINTDVFKENTISLFGKENIEFKEDL